MAGTDDMRPDPARVRIARERDAALARLSRARGWALVGVLGLTAGFTELVSALAPGRTLTSAHAAGLSRAQAPARGPGGAAGGVATLGLFGPSSPPASSSAPPASASTPSTPSAAPPVSGGS